MPAWLSACKEEGPGPEIQYDGVIAIIGAGAAGLYAADYLQTKGLKVRIFEASDRVGGRIRSARIFDDLPIEPDFPVELGADRIAGTDSLWAKIISELKIPVVDLTDNTTNNFILDNAFKSENDAQADADFVSARNFLNNLASNAGSSSVQQAIQAAGLNTRTNAILNSWIGNKYGTSNDRLGVRPLAEGLTKLTRNNKERLLESNPMQDVLASRFNKIIPKVEFNMVVKRIDYGGEKIRIEGERKLSGGGIESFFEEVSKVIVAVPVSVLKGNDIVFNPAVPVAKNTALSRVGMDAAIRVLMDFKQNFWGTGSAYLYGGTQAPEYFNTGVLRSELNKTLSVTIYGPKAEEFSALGSGMIQQILSELDAIFDGKATQNIRKDDAGNMIVVIQDWLKEPYIKGGISYVKSTGSIQDRAMIALPLNNVVFFAGEATDSQGEAGTINGALLSAERASQELIASLPAA